MLFAPYKSMQEATIQNIGQSQVKSSYINLNLAANLKSGTDTTLHSPNQNFKDID